MRCTVREARKKIDYEEFLDYILYYKEYPPLNDHLTLMLANISHTVWNANYKKGMKRLKLKDFMPDYERTFETQEDRARKAVENMRSFARGNKLIKVKKEA